MTKINIEFLNENLFNFYEYKFDIAKNNLFVSNKFLSYFGDLKDFKKLSTNILSIDKKIIRYNKLKKKNKKFFRYFSISNDTEKKYFEDCFCFYKSDNEHFLKGYLLEIDRNVFIKKKLERFFKTLIRNIDSAGFYITSRNGKIIYADKKIRKMLGYENITDIQKRNLNSPGAFLNNKERKEFLKNIDAKEKVLNRESAWLKTNGQVVYVLENSIGLSKRNGKFQMFAGFVFDITPIKTTYYEALLKKTFFDNFFNEFPFPAYLKNDRLQLIAANKAFMSFFEIKEKFIGNFYFLSDDLACEIQYLEKKAVERYENEQIEIVYVNSKGRSFNIELRLFPFFNSIERREYVVGILIDITAIREAQKELMLQNIKLESLADERLKQLFSSQNQIEALLLASQDLAFILDNRLNVINYRISKLLVENNEITALLIQKIIDKGKDKFVQCLNKKNAEFEIDIAIEERVLYFKINAAPIFDYQDLIAGVAVTAKDITELKQSLNEAYKSKLYLEKIIEFLPDPLFIKDKNGFYIEVNKAFCDLFGLTRDNILFKTDFDIFSYNQARILRIGERKALLGKEIEENDITLTIRDGLKKYCSIKITSIFALEQEQILIGIIRDLTDFEKTRRAAIENEIKFRSIAENSTDLIIRIDLNFVVSYANEAFRKTFNIQNDRLNKKIFELNLPDNIDIEISNLIIDSIKKGKSICKEIRLSDGKWYSVKAAPEIIANSKESNILFFLTDITPLKKSIEELNKAIIAQQELNQLRSNFISIASHEFKTPLSVINSSIQLLDRFFDRWSKEDIFAQLNNIRNATSYLIKLVKDISIANKTASFSLSPNFQRVSISKFIEETVKEAQTLDEKKRNFIVDIENNLKSSFISTDPYLLKNILLNLLYNALKYSDKDIIINLSEIKFEDIKYFVIKVIDKGIGIDSDELNKIFEPFYRGKNVGDIKGSGLGLYVSKTIAELIECSINVKSEPNYGSEFSLIIPAKL